ncbi:tRNA (N6-isopentenyl adenosine(37)-C2)-methylthiotransferase MiaB [Eubacteriales bacterium OttesenSCG-928-N13]|nr:tRNA (N6-isopentenyl adenosine(37)-C2)-methylthiotransferase MiaB [Eubacteriales bacterium OttesenSCG-928-N13]
MSKRPIVTEQELSEQRLHMQKVHDMKEADAPKYHIVTYGCQMNVRDSETIAGMLEQMGYSAASRKEDADLVLYNTCCVRENAENRALGNVIWLKELKKTKPELLICVGGCMMQEDGVADRLIQAYPFIDLIFGTHNLHRFPQLLHRTLDQRTQVCEVLETDGEIAEGLPVKRNSAHSAYITIMYGCNNFCSYCIVPYVRGRERSRDAELILSEAQQLMDSGVQEITLLGQNVNSYGGGGAAFAELLYRLDKMGVPRIRFMTSHPKDLSDELIAAYKELPRLMNSLHLPVQAGNDLILDQMNRRYSRAHYLDLVRKLRDAVPDIGLTSDIIVGFPGETKQEFEDTMSLVEQVRYDAAFTFIYSPRAGTSAAKMTDPTPMKEKSERIEQLIALQQQIGQEILSEQIGLTQTVLVEGESTRNPGAICGKTERGHMVNFPGNVDLTGKLIPVRIISAGRNTLRGEMQS